MLLVIDPPPRDKAACPVSRVDPLITAGRGAEIGPTRYRVIGTSDPESHLYNVAGIIRVLTSLIQTYPCIENTTLFVQVTCFLCLFWS
jgi:hypothetical protein